MGPFTQCVLLWLEPKLTLDQPRYELYSPIVTLGQLLNLSVLQVQVSARRQSLFSESQDQVQNCTCAGISAYG